MSRGVFNFLLFFLFWKRKEGKVIIKIYIKKEFFEDGIVMSSEISKTPPKRLTMRG